MSRVSARPGRPGRDGYQQRGLRPPSSGFFEAFGSSWNKRAFSPALEMRTTDKPLDAYEKIVRVRDHTDANSVTPLPLDGLRSIHETVGLLTCDSGAALAPSRSLEVSGYG